MAASLTSTTDANGAYAFSGQVPVRSPDNRARDVENGIQFQKNAVVFDASTPAMVSVKLYTTLGALVARRYTGYMNRGRSRSILIG